MRELILGIDALDPHLISDFLPFLPTFSWLSEKARWHLTHCDADIPNSPAGWSTIYSGLPSKEHGITDWDYIAEIKGQWKGTTHLLPRTFWGEINQAGLSIGLMCPPLTWPALDVKGWAVAGFPTPYQFPDQMHNYQKPDELYSSEEIKELEPIGHIVDVVQYKERDEKRELDGPVVQAIESLPMLRLEYALRAFRKLSVDVGFIFFSYLDRLCHTLNKLCFSEREITPEQARDRLLWAYKKIDRTIALALYATNPDRVLIFGDHGHTFSTHEPAIYDNQWISNEPCLIGHTATTVTFILDSREKGGQGEDIPLTHIYEEILSVSDNEIIKDKLRQLGYI